MLISRSRSLSRNSASLSILSRSTYENRGSGRSPKGGRAYCESCRFDTSLGRALWSIRRAKSARGARESCAREGAGLYEVGWLFGRGGMLGGFPALTSRRSSATCPRYCVPNCLLSGVPNMFGLGGDPAELALWSRGPLNL